MTETPKDTSLGFAVDDGEDVARNPAPDTVDPTGNIGDGTRDRISLNGTVPFDELGLEHLRLSLASRDVLHLALLEPAIADGEAAVGAVER